MIGIWIGIPGSSLAAGGGYVDIVREGVLAGFVTYTRADASSCATYFDSAGVMQIAAANIPRKTYDPSTLALRGLLIEEERTNLLTYSADFSNAAWAANNTTVTTNTTAAPDGTTTADTITVDVSGSASRYQTVSCAALRYTFSVYLRAGTDSAASFGIYQGSWVAQTGVIISGPGTLDGGSSYQTITGLSSSEWTRVAVTTDAAVSASTLRCFVYPGGVSNTSGDTTICWGAQLEAGAFATPYIPTTSAAVTRAADVAVVSDLTDIGYNASEGTLYIEGYAAPGIGASSINILSLSDGTANELIALRHVTGGTTIDYTVVDGGVAQVDTAGTAVTAGAAFKAAIAWKVNDFAQSVNGGAAQTDASGTVPTVDRLALGAFNGTIKNARLYPRVFDSAELQALTA